MTQEEESLSLGSSAVQAHLGMLQSVIERMASRSASAKTWCVTLVAAIVVVVPETGAGPLAISVIPILMFFVLDAYYLGLEKGFRKTYEVFVEKLHKSELETEDVFIVKTTGSPWGLFWDSTLSFSIWPFYGTLLAVVVVVTEFIS